VRWRIRQKLNGEYERGVRGYDWRRPTTGCNDLIVPEQSAYSSLELTAIGAYPEAHRAIDQLATKVSTSLAPQLVGMYFDGSIALGDFDPDRSDVDLVVVTDDRLSDLAAAELSALHETLARYSPTWGDEVEVLYVSVRDLNQHAVENRNVHRYVERGTGGLLRTRPFGLGWLVHLRVLSRQGITITGPDIRGLIAPVPDEALRHFAALGAENRLRLYRDDYSLLARPGARAFAVLTACRMLHTFRTGGVVSKTEAAQSALQFMDPPLANVIHAAMGWRKDHDDLAVTPEETVALLLFVRDQCASGDS
jgi:predicted nucleotidyltransferase